MNFKTQNEIITFVFCFIISVGVISTLSLSIALGMWIYDIIK